MERDSRAQQDFVHGWTPRFGDRCELEARIERSWTKVLRPPNLAINYSSGGA